LLTLSISCVFELAPVAISCDSAHTVASFSVALLQATAVVFFPRSAVHMSGSTSNDCPNYSTLAYVAAADTVAAAS